MQEPATIEELFSALDRLKAAGLVPLAHGGQALQENILFLMLLANMGGTELYLKVLRDRDQKAIASDAFTRVLRNYGRQAERRRRLRLHCRLRPQVAVPDPWRCVCVPRDR